MDPNELLKSILSRANEVLSNEDNHDSEFVELAQQIKDLHEWISKGGFLPEEWTSFLIKANVRTWFDKRNGNNYAQINYWLFKGNVEVYNQILPVDLIPDNQDNYLHEILKDLGSKVGFEQYKNGGYPQVTEFCRKNNIKYSFSSYPVKKNEIL